jgi:DNA-binding YbaB/EbfC family protein
MFGDLGKVMKIMGQMKTKLPEMREKLAVAEFTAQAGGGRVAATVNGRMQLLDLKIDPAALAESNLDAGLLEDLIKAAVAAAQNQATDAMTAAMKELTGGTDIPGLADMM